MPESPHTLAYNFKAFRAVNLRSTSFEDENGNAQETAQGTHQILLDRTVVVCSQTGTFRLERKAPVPVGWQFIQIAPHHEHFPVYPPLLREFILRLPSTLTWVYFPREGASEYRFSFDSNGDSKGMVDYILPRDLNQLTGPTTCMSAEMTPELLRTQMVDGDKKGQRTSSITKRVGDTLTFIQGPLKDNLIEGDQCWAQLDNTEQIIYFGGCVGGYRHGMGKELIISRAGEPAIHEGKWVEGLRQGPFEVRSRSFTEYIHYDQDIPRLSKKVYKDGRVSLSEAFNDSQYEVHFSANGEVVTCTLGSKPIELEAFATHLYEASGFTFLSAMGKQLSEPRLRRLCETFGGQKKCKVAIACGLEDARLVTTPAPSLVDDTKLLDVFNAFEDLPPVILAQFNGMRQVLSPKLSVRLIDDLVPTFPAVVFRKSSGKDQRRAIENYRRAVRDYYGPLVSHCLEWAATFVLAKSPHPEHQEILERFQALRANLGESSAVQRDLTPPTTKSLDAPVCAPRPFPHEAFQRMERERIENARLLRHQHRNERDAIIALQRIERAQIDEASLLRDQYTKERDAIVAEYQPKIDAYNASIQIEADKQRAAYLKNKEEWRGRRTLREASIPLALPLRTQSAHLSGFFSKRRDTTFRPLQSSISVPHYFKESSPGLLGIYQGLVLKEVSRYEALNDEEKRCLDSARGLMANLKVQNSAIECQLSRYAKVTAHAIVLYERGGRITQASLEAVIPEAPIPEALFTTIRKWTNPSIKKGRRSESKSQFSVEALKRCVWGLMVRWCEELNTLRVIHLDTPKEKLLAEVEATMREIRTFRYGEGFCQDLVDSAFECLRELVTPGREYVLTSCPGRARSSSC